MGLSSHELYLVLRARDEASRVLRGFGNEFTKLSGKQLQAAQRQLMAGAALTTVGIGLAGAGLAGVSMMNDMTNAAANYNQQVASTFTQVDKVNVSMKDLSDMGLRVAKTVPVAFDQIQPALYDIFSSIDVNAPQAEVLLRAIGKAAVGGSVDMETAGRATIAVLNAYKMPAEQVTKVNDVMFQLVRKGVGTYQQFTSVIGRAVPSAIRAGQSFESLGGMMAFMTRNGLSAAMAATSSARALDALSNPKTVAKFAKWGVALTDAKGKFRPVVDIIADMRKKLEGLSPAARSAKLQDLFKGSGGTIQAMRFFNLALADSKNLLPEMTKAMQNAGGAADAAYKIMANTPQAKIQEMNNKYQAMKVTVGNQLLPVKLKLISVLSKLLDAWDKLNPNVQKAIVWFVAVGSALAAIVGVVMVVAGGIVMLSAALAIAGIGMGTFLVIIGAVVIGIGLLVVAAILIAKHWDLIKEKGLAAWNAIKDKLTDVWNGLANFRDNVSQFVQEVWSYLQPIVSKVWNDIQAGISSMVNTIKPYWDQFVAAIQNASDKARTIGIGIGNALTHVFEFLKPVIYAVVGVFGILASIVGGVLRVAFEAIGGIIGNLIQIFTGLINFVVNVLTGNWKGAWDAILSILKGFVGIVVNLWNFLVGAIGSIVSNLVKGVIGFFKHLWDVLVGHSIIPDMVNAIISWIGRLPGRVLAFIANLVSQFISKIASMASTVTSRIVSFIGDNVRYFSAMPGRIISAIASLASRLYSSASSAMTRMRDAISSGASTLLGYVRGIPSRIVSAIGSLGGLLWGAGKALMDGLKNGIAAGWSAITSSVSSMGQWIKDHKGPKSYDLKLLEPAGKWIMQGLHSGLTRNFGLIRRAVGQVNAMVSGVGGRARFSTGFTGGTGPATPPGYGGPTPPGYGPGGGPAVHVTVNTQEINPVKHAADLGWEIARNSRY